MSSTCSRLSLEDQYANEGKGGNLVRGQADGEQRRARGERAASETCCAVRLLRRVRLSRNPLAGRPASQPDS